MILVGFLGAVLLAAYTAGYFILGRSSISVGGDDYRTFYSGWLCSAYGPAGYIEARASGRDVCFVAEDTGDWLGFAP